MSHYTAIKTKYKNSNLLKTCINQLAQPYSEHKATIQLYRIPEKKLSSTLSNKTLPNYLAFQFEGISYNIISDFQSWTQKDGFNKFLKRLEINYGYSEIISQALQLGFVRSKKLINKNQNNKFVFQRCIEITT